MAVAAQGRGVRSGGQSLAFIIGASSVGTLIEWCDI
jgi:hypothetical protein